MNTNTTTLLLSIFTILLIYCVMYYFIYDKKTFVDDSILDKKAFLLDVMNEKVASQKEKFAITYDELEEYNKKLKSVNDYLAGIDASWNSYNDEITKEKSKINANIKNLYTQQYIDYINKGNAASYNEFMKFVKPEENPYYNQYL